MSDNFKTDDNSVLIKIFIVFAILFGAFVYKCRDTTENARTHCVDFCADKKEFLGSYQVTGMFTIDCGCYKPINQPRVNQP